MSDMIPAWVNGSLKPVEKISVHEQGLKHKAVSVFVMDGQNVLIQRRAMTKYHTPGLWANTCCTHPDWGEKSAECAVRRLKEELGISGLYPSFQDTVEYRADVGNGMIEHEVVDLFLATPDERPALDLNPDEVQATRWISLDDLEAEVAQTPEVFTPWLRIYLDQHKASVFGPA